MKLSSLLRSLKSQHAGSKRRARNQLLNAGRRVPVVELLEDRRMLAVVWDRIEPLGSLIFQSDVTGELGVPVSVFSDDFESGSLGPAWTTNSSIANGRVGVSNVLGTPTNNGSFHLAMDTSPSGAFNRNEAILTVDLSSVSAAGLEFAHKDVGDEDLALPATFIGSINGDGVSISDDGTTWHRLVSLNNANSPNQVYTDFSFDLGAAATTAGISLGSNFQIKFQQYDNFAFNSDGRTFDDVAITAPGSLSEITTAFLEADQTLTVVATPDESSTTLTATVRDPSNVILATATASGPGETLEIQTIGIAADGDYTVEITGDATGDYDLSLYRNASVEVFDTDDGSEQDATGSFIPLGSGRFGIVGNFGGDGGGGDEEEVPLVWAIQPSSGDILKIDPQTGSIFGSFPAPDAISPNHRVSGLSIAEEGNTLLYVNGGINGTNLYRLDPDNGAVQSLEFLPTNGSPVFRGGLSFESGSTDSIFAIDDGGPVDRQAGYGGSISDWTPSGAEFPGALGGDDNGRLFVVRLGQIQEFSTTVANSQLNSFALPAGSVGGSQGLAFDGVNLYSTDVAGNVFTLDPDTGAILNQVTVPGGFLTGLGADFVPASSLLPNGGDSPAATPDIYGDPGEPGRFPPGPNVPAQAVAPSELLVNGSFETGNFTGWTTVTTASPFRPWAVTGAGQGGGFGMLQTQPQDGAFVAWNGFDGSGPMEFQMYQDVTISAGSTATLSWMDRVQWNFTLGGTVTVPRLYDVEIRDPGTNAILQNVFSFSTGTQATNPTGNTNWQTHSVDVSAFAGQTVRLFFREQVPQAFTGPAQVEIDAVSLTEDVAGTVETMYGSVGRNSINAGGLLLVDQTTGAGTLVSDPITPGGLPGLAYDSATDVLFGSTNRTTGVGTSTLVRLDPDTGALLSTVGTITDGPTGPAFGVGDLAIQPGTGVLFGIRSSSAGLGGRLYTIDKTTAVATLVGNTFQNRGGGLGFAPDGTLYYAEFNQLHTLNPANAAILSTVSIVGAAPDGLGIRPSDGTLFSTQAGGGSQLIHTINPATGVATVLGTTGAGGASDLAFRVTGETAGPDVDEYLLDLTGKAGQPIDIAFSTDLDLSGGTGAQFNESLTETNNVFFPNVLNFDFTGAPSPTGDATLQVDAIADLSASSEFLVLDAEGLFSQNLFVTGGLDLQPVSTTVTIPEAILAQLAADGTISFTVSTSGSQVHNFGSSSLTFELTYAAASGGDVTLELLDTDGTTVLATGMDVSENFDLGILEFFVPADGIYTVRVTGEGQGAYGIVVTDPLVFDTEANQPNSSPLRSLDAYDGALGFLSDATTGGDVDLSLLTSFESLDIFDSGFIPPDPILAAGPSSVIAMVNTDIAIHNKTTGAVIAQSDLDGGGGFWATNNIVFDPWITYDPDSGRFMAMGVDRLTSGGGSSRIYLSVSTDSTPTNLTTDWNKYVINRTGTAPVGGATTFPDYPKLGVDDDAIYITGNDFRILGGGFSHVSLFAIEKAPVLSGGPANIVYDENITGGAFSVHPVTNYDAGAPMHFAEAVGTTGIRVHTLTNVLTAPSRTTTTVGVPTFLFPPDVPQQGGPPLDSVSQRIMSGVVRDGSLWTGHAIVDPSIDGETVMRWYEFDVSGTPSLVQSGNVDPGPGVHTWMGHVNVDNDGDMGIAFSISGPTQFAGIGYTGRLATDAPGTTRPVEIARVGDGSYSRFDGIGRNRWGDYSGLAVDPDGESFWLYNEYAAAGNNWATFVGEFQVEPGLGGSPDVDTYEITLAAGEQIGLSTITPFDDPIDSLNLLDPALEVLDPSGISVAFDSNSGTDGKNAALPVFTAGAAGVYKVIVSAEDDGDGEYVLSVNWAPVLESLALSAGMIFENESVFLTGAYSDQNLDDSHGVVVDWGDPNDPVDSTFAVPAINTLTVGDNFVATDGAVLEITALDLLTGEVSFKVGNHQYLDDGLAPGNGTVEDSSSVSVTITDSGGLTAAPSTQEFIVNGDFETGNLTGWSVSGTGSAIWQINDGTLDPNGPGLALAPIAGSFDAVSVSSGPGLAMLTEPIVVPPVVSSAVLSWSDRIRNHAATYSDPGQEWRVLVLDSGGSLIQEVYSTNPGDPLTQLGPNNRSFDLTTLFQSLAGQTVQVSFEQQSQFFFMNATLDNVSLKMNASPSVLVKNVAPDLVLDPVAMINENEAATLTGMITDPGLLDVHDVVVAWDDPNATADSTFSVPATSTLTVGDTINSASDGAVLEVTAVDLSIGMVSFSVQHVYADDGVAPGNGTISDVSTISAVVNDDDLGSSSGLGSGPIYTTEGNGTRLGTIDQNTGVGTDIGPFGTSQTWAAAFDTDGTLYTLINGFSGNAILASVNQTTGAATTVGTGVGTNMISLEVATDGTMYGIGYNDRILYEIDQNTGIATAIGDTGIFVNMDLAFDSSGTMYATTGNRLYTVNPTTATSTLLGTYTGILSGSVMGIMFDENDTLFATAYISNSPLYEIDVNTLSATVIGNTGFFAPHGGDILLGGEPVTTDVLVKNVAPEQVQLSGLSMINENDTYVLSGSFNDPGLLDEHDITVDWDDPNDTIDSTFELSATTDLSVGDTFSSTTDTEVLTITNVVGGTVSYSVSHQYLDDGLAPGNNTAADFTDIRVFIDDDDLGSGLGALFFDVKNVAPTISSVVVNATKDNKVLPGDDVNLAATFTDIGRLDRHGVVIEWDDGTVNSVFNVDATADLTVGDSFTSTSGDGSVLTITNVVPATGEVSFLVESHQFGTGGIFEVIVTLTDDDTGVDTGGTQAWASGLRITNGVLQVIGTSGDDHVTINQQGNGILKVHADFLQTGNFETFDLADVDKIIAYLCEGDDHFTIAGNVDIPAIVHGDAGDDHLNGGGGPTVLLGDDGDDMLVGGSGRDILIGGLGLDRLVGGKSDDVLIGGTTNADDDDDALMDLLAAWTSNDSYEDRVDAIDALLTVFDDEEEDKLTGSSGQDLFYDGLDDILTDVKTKKDTETVL